MNSLAKHAVAALGFIVTGAVVSLAVALPQRAEANPDPGVSYGGRVRVKREAAGHLRLTLVDGIRPQ
jgi:hypothetical protein